MPPTYYLSQYVQRILDDGGGALVMRVLLVGALIALPALALAYPGEQLVNYARNNIVAPLCFLAIAVAICAALIRPQVAVAVVWVTVISLFLMWILSNGQSITSQLQSPN
jgi:hypothetical protein